MQCECHHDEVRCHEYLEPAPEPQPHVRVHLLCRTIHDIRHVQQRTRPQRLPAPRPLPARALHLGCFVQLTHCSCVSTDNTSVPRRRTVDLPPLNWPWPASTLTKLVTVVPVPRTFPEDDQDGAIWEAADVAGRGRRNARVIRPGHYRDRRQPRYPSGEAPKHSRVQSPRRDTRAEPVPVEPDRRHVELLRRSEVPGRRVTVGQHRPVHRDRACCLGVIAAQASDRGHGGRGRQV